MSKKKIALAVGLSLTLGFCSIGLAACGGDNKGNGGGGGGGNNPKPGDKSDWYIAGALQDPTYDAKEGGSHFWKGDKIMTTNDVYDAFSFRYTETADQYTLTINLYKNDEFNINKVGGSWLSQKGDDLLGPTDTLFVSTTGGGAVGNIKVTQDGKYTITLSFDDAEVATLTYERVADVPALPVDVEKVELNRYSVVLELGVTPTFQLDVTITPANADEKDNITFTSSDPTVASVDEHGLITAHKKGTATISVECGGKYSEDCTVTVLNEGEGIPAESVELNKTETTLKIGHITEKLEATALPAITTDTAAWESSDPTVATVDNEGNITAVKPGTATITVKYGTGENAPSDECVVTILDEYFLAGSLSAIEDAGHFNANFKTAVADVAFVQDAEDENVYKLTGITLNKRDEFKVVFASMDGSSWNGALGAAKVDEASKTAGYVGGTDNITVLDSGIYTITLDLSSDTPVSLEMTKDLPEPAVQSVKVGIYGGFNGWSFTDIEATKQGDNFVAVFDDVEVTAAGEFQFRASVDGGATVYIDNRFNLADQPKLDNFDSVDGVSSGTGNGNYQFTAAGTYKFTVTFNADGDLVSIVAEKK